MIPLEDHPWDGRGFGIPGPSGEVHFTTYLRLIGQCIDLSNQVHDDEPKMDDPTSAAPGYIGLATP